MRRSGQGGLWALVAAVVVAGIVTLVAFAMAVAALMKVDTPVARAQSLLSFAQAAATLLLVTLTGLYARSTHIMAREMKVQREEIHERARRAQARRVWARLTDTDRSSDYIEATIHNASEEPISDAALRLLDWSWRSEPVVISARVYPFLAPGEYGEQVPVGPLGPVPDRAESPRPPIEIRFTDANGLHWCRDPDGRLVLLDQ